ncbi:MAG: hypothetical protein M3014_11240 [Chloroflexota bacterium]|nr:hypothetical protein [Chloroflexota bacterium]
MRYETHTHLAREAVFAEANRFFGDGEGGLGMKKSAQQGNQVAFFGDGLIWVTVWPSPPGKPIRVDVDVSRRDADAKAFIEKVLKTNVTSGTLGRGA